MDSKKVVKYVILNASILLYLGFILGYFPAELSEEFMFMTPDSQEYLSTGKSFFNYSGDDYLLTRPYFFPLILAIFHAIGGYMLWFVLQISMWVLSINLLFASFEKMKLPIVMSVFAIVCFSANLSLIAMIFHGLTEITVVFLLCWLCYIISSNLRDFFSMEILFKILLLLVVLTIVKPLFLIPTIVFSLFIVAFHVKSLLRFPKKVVILLLLLTPIFMQVLLVKASYDKFTFSEISSLTYRRYIFTQLYQENHNCDRDTALEVTDRMTNDQIKEISKEDFGKLFSIYQENLKYNLNGYPVFLEFSKTNMNLGYVNKMKGFNDWLDYLFHISVYWFLLVLIHVLYKRTFARNVGIFFIGILMYYIYLTSGISAYQGDRLVIIALPLSVIFYFYIVNYLFQEVKNVMQDLRQIREK